MRLADTVKCRGGVPAADKLYAWATASLLECGVGDVLVYSCWNSECD